MKGFPRSIGTASAPRLAPDRFAPVFLAAVLLGLVTTSSPAQQERTVTDEGITSRIEKQLEGRWGDSSAKVEASTKEGAVTLTGTVPTVAAREQAVEIAGNIRGVRSVENKITVQTVARSDEQIEADVRAALAADPATGNARDVRVEVKEGVVTLSGTAGSWPLAELAADSIGNIRGIKDIRNEIRVGDQAGRSDEEIAGQILARINADAGLWGSSTKAEVRDGKVTLSGTVPSAAAKSRLVRDAWVPGVTAVESRDVEVRSSGGGVGREEPASTARTDDQVRASVMNALLSDPRVGGSRPEVTVKDGVVMLTGEVDSLAARRAAERAARDIAGVRQVRNDLRVQTVERSSAEQTAQAVVDALERDAFLGDDKIKVTVDGGTVQLRGDLDSSAEVLRAQEIASGIGGVVAVRNGLTVGGRSVEGPGLELPAYYHPFVRTYPAVGFRSRPRTDAEIKDDIEDEMFWSPFVDGKKVAVAVENGIATLTGTVDTWGEHNAAIENAHEGGARDVRDQLKVRQGPADRR